MCSKCSNKLSQLGAFLLLAVLLSVSAFSRPRGNGTGGTATGTEGMQPTRSVEESSSPGTGGTAAGTSWTKRTSGTEKNLYGVTYGNGIFVAVGLNGTILTSPKG